MGYARRRDVRKARDLGQRFGVELIVEAEDHKCAATNFLTADAHEADVDVLLAVHVDRLFVLLVVECQLVVPFAAGVSVGLETAFRFLRWQISSIDVSLTFAAPFGSRPNGMNQMPDEKDRADCDAGPGEEPVERSPSV